MDSKGIDKLRRRCHARTPWLGGWLRRSAATALARDGSPEAVRTLVNLLSEEISADVRHLTTAALGQLKSQTAINTLCAMWQETRHTDLDALLVQRRWLASAPPELRVLTALKTDQFQAIASLGVEGIAPLMHAAEDKDRTIASRAAALLAGLQEPAQIETFCDLLGRNENVALRKLAVEKGYAPRDSVKRALFFFLTGQMERYEALDFDHRQLGAYFEAAEDEIRQAITARIRASGRAELVEIIQGGQHKRQLTGLTAREWEAIVSVLRASKRYTDLWALAFEAPPEWAAETVGVLKHVAFCPTGDADRTVFDRLHKLRPAEGKHLRLFLPVPVCRRVLHTQEQGVRALAFAPDGKTLATVGADTTTSLWDLANVRLKTTLAKRIGLVSTLAFAPDGKKLATGNVDNIARLWDTAAWKLAATFRGHTDRISALHISADGQNLASASYDNTARVWDLDSLKCRAVLAGHKASVLSLSFSPDCQTVATGSHDETVRLWHAAGGGNKATLTGNLSSVCALGFAPDGKTLAGGSSDGTVRLWHVASGEIKAILQGHKSSVMTLGFSSDGTRLATGSLDKTVRIWDVASRQLKATLHGHTDEINALAFSPDGKTLVTGSRDKTVRIWDVALTKPLIAMTREDLIQIEKWAQVLANPEEARPWHFVATLLRHRFRFDIELSEVVERVFEEFDIEIE